MKYISSFQEGDRISDIYLCKARTSAVAKNGKPYENVTLQDKTGAVSCKIWDPNSSGISDFDEMADYVLKNAGEGDLVITMGAGDIYRVGDIIKEKNR